MTSFNLQRHYDVLYYSVYCPGAEHSNHSCLLWKLMQHAKQMWQRVNHWFLQFHFSLEASCSFMVVQLMQRLFLNDFHVYAFMVSKYSRKYLFSSFLQWERSFKRGKRERVMYLNLYLVGTVWMVVLKSLALLLLTLQFPEMISPVNPDSLWWSCQGKQRTEVTCSTRTDKQQPFSLMVVHHKQPALITFKNSTVMMRQDTETEIHSEIYSKRKL